MFIKATLVRLNEKDQVILFPSLLNENDIKGFQLDVTTNKVSVLYKSYNDIGEEMDELQEDMKTIAERLTSAKLYLADIPVTTK